jgi:hypothetical protein
MLGHPSFRNSPKFLCAVCASVVQKNRWTRARLNLMPMGFPLVSPPCTIQIPAPAHAQFKNAGSVRVSEKMTTARSPLVMYGSPVKLRRGAVRSET